MSTAVRERPILFSGPMIRAILDGRKSQTRRVIALNQFGPSTTPGYDWIFRCRRGLWQDYRTPDLIRQKCPYGQPGDRLWVRETWAYYPDGEHVIYRAREGNELAALGTNLDGLWRPSIHMPRWASRITLEITGVRVERVQDISEEDAWAEGFPDPAGRNHEYPDRARYWFRRLWDEINGRRPGCSWGENPFVWAITFRRVEP